MDHLLLNNNNNKKTFVLA